MRDPELLAARNKEIREIFKKMQEEREFGVRKYRSEYIVAKLSQKFYLSTYTIDGIVFTSNPE